MGSVTINLLALPQYNFCFLTPQLRVLFSSFLFYCPFRELRKVYLRLSPPHTHVYAHMHTFSQQPCCWLDLGFFRQRCPCTPGQNALCSYAVFSSSMGKREIVVAR